MKIRYITNVRIPTPRAQGYAIMKMCEQFSLSGVQVELIIPNRANKTDNKDPFSLYDIEPVFKIRKVFSLDLLSWAGGIGRFAYWIDLLFFLFLVRLGLATELGEVIYTRDYMTLLITPKDSFVALELHDISGPKFIFKKLVKKANVIFVLNSQLKKDLIALGVENEKIFISPSGVDIDKFDIDLNKINARKKLALPEDKKIVVYTGHFYDWKGVDVLAESAKTLSGIFFVFVGGVKLDFERIKNKYGELKNLLIKGSEDYNRMPIYMKAADVLVLPNSEKKDISLKYTSPLKLFEYMASERPIVASDLPSIREILNDSNAILIAPDNSSALADGIRNALENKELSSKISKEAYNDVQKFSWQNRAAGIIKAINGITHGK